MPLKSSRELWKLLLIISMPSSIYLGIAFYLKKDTEAAFQIFDDVEKELNRMVGAEWSFGNDALFLTTAQDRRTGIIFLEKRL